MKYSEREIQILYIKHICGIQKNDADESTCKVEIDTDVENKCMDTKEESGQWDELGDWD